MTSLAYLDPGTDRPFPCPPIAVLAGVGAHGLVRTIMLAAFGGDIRRLPERTRLSLVVSPGKQALGHHLGLYEDGDGAFGRSILNLHEDRVPREVTEAVEEWASRLFPIGCRLSYLHLSADVHDLVATEPASLSTSDVDELRRIVEAAGRAMADNQRLGFAIDRRRVPRTIRAGRLHDRWTNAKAPGLQRWLNAHPNLLGEAMSLTIDMALPGVDLEPPPRTHPLPVRRSKPNDRESRLEGGVERVHSEALVRVSCPAADVPVLLSRSDVSRLLLDLDLGRIVSPRETVVYEVDREVLGRPVHLPASSILVDARAASEMTLADPRTGGERLRAVLANPEMDRLARCDWSPYRTGGGAALYDPETYRIVARVRSTRSAHYAEFYPLDRPAIVCVYGFRTAVQARRACERGLADVGAGTWRQDETVSMYRDEIYD